MHGPACTLQFRETVGKALWGEDWERVLEGGPDADKIEVVLRIGMKTCA